MADRKSRLDQAYSKFRERKDLEKEEMKKIQEETAVHIKQADEDALEKQFLEMAKKYTGKGSALASQRIQKEYVGMLSSLEFKDKVSVDMFKDNMYIWKVSFDLINYEISKQLKEDFEALDSKLGQMPKLQYEVIFSPAFPHEPPFIRVVFPRFAFHTGHITVGGSICMQSLTTSGWSSARSLESYFVEIISLINAGDARLDTQNTVPYSLQEAREAFNRVARDHGWIN